MTPQTKQIKTDDQISNSGVLHLEQKELTKYPFKNAQYSNSKRGNPHIHERNYRRAGRTGCTG